MIPDITIVAVSNPGDEEATVFVASTVLSAEEVIEQYGNKINHGAFVSVTYRDGRGNTTRVLHFIADRSVSSLYLQNNEFMADEDDAPDVDDIGTVVASGYAPLETPEEELETYTVFGRNDDSENFVAVVTATEETVAEVAVKAGTVDEGCEHLVIIGAILKGDQSDLDRVSI